MTEQKLIEQYNYDEFVREKFEPWLNFDDSPPVGVPAPNFPLWKLDKRKTSLSDVWTKNDLTIIEFGSFT